MNETTIRKINPYETIFTDTPLDSEWAVKSLLAFGQAKQFGDMMHRIKQKRGLLDSDFEAREVIFTKKYPHELEHPNLFQYAEQHYKLNKSIDNNMKFGASYQECLRRKYFFWRNNSKIIADTKEKYESRQKIRDSIRNYKIYSQLGFFFCGLCIIGLMKLNKNSILQRGITLGLAIVIGNIYGGFKYSSKIFDDIPKLPDKELEQQRLDVFNYCFSLDLP